MSSATSPWEERESSISRSPSSAACPGATFARGVSFSQHLPPPHRPPTMCLPGPVLTHAVLAPSPLLNGISASLRRLLCTSAPLDGQMIRIQTEGNKTKGRRETKGNEKVRGPQLPKEISRRVSLTKLVPATTAAVGSPVPCSL